VPWPQHGCLAACAMLNRPQTETHRCCVRDTCRLRQLPAPTSDWTVSAAPLLVARPSRRPAMLSAISGAKEAKKNAATDRQRLLVVEEKLDASTASALETLLPKLTANSEADALKEADVKRELDRLKREAKQACADFATLESAGRAKQLRDKDLFWKLKLETNRVATRQQLKNQATALEVKAENKLRAKMLELQGDTGKALEEAVGRLEASEDTTRKLEKAKEKLESTLEGVKLEAAEKERRAAKAQKELEGQVANAKKEAEAKEKEMLAELDGKTREIHRLSAQAEEAERLRGEVEAMSAKMAGLQKETDKAKAERDEAAGALAGAHEDARAAKASAAEAAAERDVARSELARSQAEAASVASKLEAAEAEVAGLTGELAKVSSALEEERKAAGSMREQLDAAQVRLKGRGPHPHLHPDNDRTTTRLAPPPRSSPCSHFWSGQGEEPGGGACGSDEEAASDECRAGAGAGGSVPSWRSGREGDGGGGGGEAARE
jgi:hypothetical protein